MSKFFAVGLLGCVLVAPASAGDPKVDSGAAFEKLKGLAGTWTVEGMGDEPSEITYEVTAGGSAVLETYFPGTSKEMLSVYHLDGDDLVMTHYCMIGNQPRMRLDRDASTLDDLHFAFDGGTNLDPSKDMHMHEAEYIIKDADHLESRCTGWTDGKAAGCTPFEMTRKP